MAVWKQMVTLDGSGKPLAVLETGELALRRFHEVDERLPTIRVKETVASPSGNERIGNTSVARMNLPTKKCCSIARVFV
jgi:hypothetical protein